MKTPLNFVVASAVALALTAVVAPAADPVTNPPAPAVESPALPAPVVEKPGGEAAAPAAEPVAEKSVIDYHDAELQNVVRSLATRAGINLIMGEEVVGKVTVHFEGVGHEEAIKFIVESKGFAYVKDRDVVRIKTKESLDAEPVEARYVSLNYAKADEIKKTLETLLSRQGKVQVDTRGNGLVFSDTPSSLNKILPLIEKMDTQTAQVMIEAKFVETTKNPKKDLGINWAQTLTDHKLSAGPFNLSKNLAGAPWVPSTALLDAGSATILFSYMNSDSESELLASPRVVTVDNAKAKIAIATQFPIPQFTYSESKGAFSITGFEYRDIGIVLNCTPHINKNEFVTLEVAPEAGSQAGVASFQGVDIPIIDNRTASTTVLIKSGNTLAMGGLMRQDSSDKHTKVPVMGDLPGVGALFRSKSLSKTKRELLIFLTPTIVSPDGKGAAPNALAAGKLDEVYTNDKWMPNDNAKPNPRNLIPGLNSHKRNFGP